MESNEESFLSVLSAQQLESLLTPQDVLKIHGKLWEVLRGRAESYTQGGSSSMRVETAQELLKSAGFVIRLGLGGGDPETIKAHLLGDEFDTLFKMGVSSGR